MRRSASPDSGLRRSVVRRTASERHRADHPRRPRHRLSHPLQDPTCTPALRVADGRDGNIWFSEQGTSKIGRLTPRHTDSSAKPLPDPSSPYDSARQEGSDPEEEHIHDPEDEPKRVLTNKEGSFLA